MDNPERLAPGQILDLYEPGAEDRPCPGCGQRVRGERREVLSASRAKNGVAVAVWILEAHRAPCGLACDGAGESQKGVHRTSGCAACRAGQRLALVRS